MIVAALIISLLANVFALVVFVASLKMWRLSKAGVTPEAYMAWKRQREPEPEAAAPVPAPKREPSAFEPEFPSREEMRATQAKLEKMQGEMCHDKRCPGRNTLKHKCHDLDCKRHCGRAA
jgi:hypothetical protein